MSHLGVMRSVWLIVTAVVSMLAWTTALPAVASSPSPFSSASPCPGAPLSLKLGTTTPVVLVHGFNEGPGVFTAGSPSLVDTLKAAIPNVTTIAFDYHMANTDWVTDPATGPQLAQCITWLAHTSDTQDGPGKVIIVGHSMGGLAIRCAVDPTCVQNGGKGPAANASVIELVITLGTPNLGSNPQTLGPVGNKICSWIPACDALLTLRDTSTAAQAMVPNSDQLKALAPLPANIPLDAMAGKISLTTSLFGSTYTIFGTSTGDIGDAVVPLSSALAEAPNGTEHAGPGAQSTTVDCGSIPLAQISVWGAATAALKAPAPPVTCWHLTETTDSRWQADIVDAVKPAVQALSLLACTPATISGALAVKDPTNADQRTLVTSACEDGWGVAEAHQPLTLSDGSVAQDTGFAILKRTDSGWISAGLDDGTCLASPSICPGTLLPPPAVLHQLLQKAGIILASAQAELYINTTFTPGALYKYLTGPSKIGIDNQNYINDLQWKAGSQGDLIGAGTLHYNTCNPDCASGNYQTFPIQIIASQPKQCSVQVYPNGLGNPSQTVNADVFNQIDIQPLQGSPPSFLTGTSVLPGPCK